MLRHLLTIVFAKVVDLRTRSRFFFIDFQRLKRDLSRFWEAPGKCFQLHTWYPDAGNLEHGLYCAVGQSGVPTRMMSRRPSFLLTS